MKRALFCLYIIACFMYPEKSASAQAAFQIPGEVSNFSNYSIPEHCIALMKRLEKQLSTEQDSTYVIRGILAEVEIDTTPLGVRKQLAACGSKFRNMKVPADSVYEETMDAQIADALLLAWAARDTSWFFSIIDNDFEKKISTSHDAGSVMSRATDAMFSFVPVSNDDLNLWDSLYTAIVTNQFIHHNGDLKVFGGLINSLSHQGRILSRHNRSRGHKVLRDLVSKVDSMGISDLGYDQDKDHPFGGAVHTIKHANRSALLSLRGDSLIETLKAEGPGRYIDALVRIEHISGFRDAVVPSSSGLGREMRALPGTVVYRDGKFLLSEGVTLDQLPNDAFYSYDSSQPYVVVYMESLCNTKAAMATYAHRTLIERSSTCLKSMEALKWISRNYPDIKVVLWTPFRGQIGTMLTETPAKESRELVKALDDFYDISADIVMYNTEFYNMPDTLDRRRVDISVDFLEWLQEMVGGYRQEAKMLVVAPGGKIIASTYSIKVVNAMMEWYRKSSGLARLGNRD